MFNLDFSNLFKSIRMIMATKFKTVRPKINLFKIIKQNNLIEAIIECTIQELQDQNVKEYANQQNLFNEIQEFVGN